MTPEARVVVGLIDGAKKAHTVESDAREKRFGRRLLIGMAVVTAVSLLFSSVAAVVAMRASSTAASVEGRQAASLVIEQARQERIAVYRERLSRANATLRAQGLPTIAVPGGELSLVELEADLSAAVGAAEGFAILPPEVVEALRQSLIDGDIPPVLSPLSIAPSPQSSPPPGLPSPAPAPAPEGSESTPSTPGAQAPDEGVSPEGGVETATTEPSTMTPEPPPSSVAPTPPESAGPTPPSPPPSATEAPTEPISPEPTFPPPSPLPPMEWPPPPAATFLARLALLVTSDPT